MDLLFCQICREVTGWLCKYKGFYYVRHQLSMYSCGTTAYASPDLVVEKKKLRQDQVDYMERKCQETQDAMKRAAEKKE